MQSGIVELDLHGKNVYQARTAIDAALRRSRGVYRLRCIHGFHGGTALRELIWAEYAGAPGILRLERVNEGTTDLILREF